MDRTIFYNTTWEMIQLMAFFSIVFPCVNLFDGDHNFDTAEAMQTSNLPENRRNNQIN